MDRSRKQIDTLFEKARERGLRPMWTHYHREIDGGGRALGATTCLLLDSEGNTVSRGAAVVSTKDIPSKAFGRALSLKRAFGAALSREPKEEVICTWGLEEDYLLKIEYLPKFISKAQKNPSQEDLSPIEISRLVARKQKKAAVG